MASAASLTCWPIWYFLQTPWTLASLHLHSTALGLLAFLLQGPFPFISISSCSQISGGLFLPGPIFEAYLE